MNELKDYDIMDIEAMDDERLEKSSSGKIFVTRVYIKDEVDAVVGEKDKENRRLKRALWLARAERAKDRAMTCDDFVYLGDTECDMNMALARTWMKCRLLKPSEWSKVWRNVERKCRAKAEEYR